MLTSPPPHCVRCTLCRLQYTRFTREQSLQMGSVVSTGHSVSSTGTTHHHTQLMGRTSCVEDNNPSRKGKTISILPKKRPPNHTSKVEGCSLPLTTIFLVSTLHQLCIQTLDANCHTSCTERHRNLTLPAARHCPVQSWPMR